ncbi:putative transmembrane protein [Toxoplasma gondii VAND]|uniref:Putative transmembrane protein n=4 Tax=Toxoplasma gondii TaxID=5811 RepID=B9QEK1_TOXGV|nr:putative transmembrane protein [Toxoplasma gondii VEG]KFG30731.1 putative transmembrane protein [Toxoplasma gondii p89]KFH12738.1 putative transmembrane protein [Toxoplasma gondii VAND]PIM00438.1 putative transmembrane protein [Toxoplasma gondii COUG]CEL76123.1 TPA: hypothetical protein BN1205_085520 [Toxoplasma gondii VEG]
MVRSLGSIALLAALVGGATATSFEVVIPESIVATRVSKHHLAGGETCTVDISTLGQEHANVVVEPSDLASKAFALKNGSCDTAAGPKPWTEIFPDVDRNFEFTSTTSTASSLIIKMPSQGGGEGFCFIVKDSTTNNSMTYEVASGAFKTAIGVVPLIGILSSVLLSMQS